MSEQTSPSAVPAASTSCFPGAALGSMLSGRPAYFLWLTLLGLLALVGLHAFARQFVEGLYSTGMTDQVSWGLYIANFTFLVGVAAAAAMIVIPVYLYDREEFHDVALFGEIMAIAAVTMCLIFVSVDLGRIDRFWHLIPGIGLFNWPNSMLSWDVLVLNGYLALNVAIVGYSLWTRFHGRHPSPFIFLPLVFVAIVWAFSIHTVTAFLYAGNPGRPFWNTALLAPRFIASAFTSGPALMIIAFGLIRHFGKFPVPARVFPLLRSIMQVTMSLHLFFMACEFFVELYGGTSHSASFQYLFFGLHGHHDLNAWAWSALLLDVIAYVLILGPRPFGKPDESHNDASFKLYLACALAFVGIWIEKGMGLVIPGFLPTPLGEIVEYTPSTNEILICVGVWAFGLFVFTVLIKAAMPILKGECKSPNSSCCGGH